MIKLNNVLLVSAFLLTLTACGGGSSGGISEEVKKESIAKISNYASNSGVEPSKQDYINAGVDSEELKFVDIDELNDLVETKESTEVDSEAELNVLAHSVMDTTAPVITLNGSSTISIALNDTYKEKGATATDKGQSVKVTFVSDVNEARIGTYKVVYTAVDKVGNKATKERTVTVVKDAIPVITLSDTSIKERGDLKSIVTAYDNEDGNIDVVVSGETNTRVTGIHHIIYTVTDSANHTVTKEVNIRVIPFTITELFNKSKELNDVSYLVVGDSTRYYEGTNDVLINSRDSDEGYYKDLLSPKKIKFMHTSIEGQRVDYWLNKDRESRGGGESFTINDTLNKIGKVNSNHCIVEFSMGINDDLHGRINKVKNDITKAINKLKKDYPNVKILLVSPVPYYSYSSGNQSKELNRKYQELKNELSLPFVSGYNILNSNYPSNAFSDKLHPKKATSKELVNGIFEQIENNSLD